MVHTGPIEDWYWQYIGTLKYTVLIHLVQLRCTILIADRYTGFPFRAVSPDTGSTYRSDRIPVRGPPAIGRYRRNRSLPTQERGDASSPRAGQGAASSYIGRMRRCLVFQRENEASPRLPTGNEASPRSLTTLFSRLQFRPVSPRTGGTYQPVRLSCTVLARGSPARRLRPRVTSARGRFFSRARRWSVSPGREKDRGDVLYRY
ncbi:hypothetical protein GW17_00062386 [Ensete ventricosum]|nr:hypothetical protein GW17_00062386 [Ensete ventricosum]